MVDEPAVVAVVFLCSSPAVLVIELKCVLVDFSYGSLGFVFASCSVILHTVGCCCQFCFLVCSVHTATQTLLFSTRNATHSCSLAFRVLVFVACLPSFRALTVQLFIDRCFVVCSNPNKVLRTTASLLLDKFIELLGARVVQCKDYHIVVKVCLCVCVFVCWLFSVAVLLVFVCSVIILAASLQCPVGLCCLLCR